jgi:hypothetical protein
VHAQNAQPLQQSRGAISGVVVDAGSGRPLAGAVVTLALQAAPSAQAPAAPPAPAPGPAPANAPAPSSIGANRQVTDPAGRFIFTSLPAGEFTITADRFGYADGGFGRSSPRAGNRRIALAEGEWFQSASIKLWRQSSISGTVLDEAGEPVVSVWVRALAQILISGQAQWVSGPVTKTDDRGMYRFAGLGPGKWTVLVPSVQSAVPADSSVYTVSGVTPEQVAANEMAGRPRGLRDDPAIALDAGHRLMLGTSATPPPAAGGQPQVYPATFYPATHMLTEAVVIDTAYGDDRAGIDIVLRPVPAFKIAGQVEGPAEALAGLVLRLMAAGNENLGLGNEAATALVGATGAFTFLSVASGTYIIVASRSTTGYTYGAISVTGNMPSPPGRSDDSMSTSAVFSAVPGTMLETRGQMSNTLFTGRAGVNVSGDDVADVVVRMERGSSISGQIVTVTTPETTAPSGLLPFLVRAEPAGGDAALGQPGVTLNRADPSAQFTIAGLQKGEYLLRMVGGGIIKSIVHDGKDYTYRPFDASNGQDISGVVVTLTNQSARLAGSVRDTQGRPITSNAVAMCFPAEREQWSRYGIQPTRLRSVTVGSDGSYRFMGLPAGDYLIIGVDDGYADAWKDPAFLEKIAASAARVTLAWGDAKSQDVPLVQVR